MTAVFACRSGPGERPGPAPAPVQRLALTHGEATALLVLAEAGRAALDADPRLLRGPGQRDAARRAVSRLRLFTQT